MTSSQKNEQPPHSAEYINDSRFQWWNADYLDLVLRRIDFDTVSTMADIGVGAAHWSALLVSKAERPLAITVVDAEERWLEQAKITLEKTPGCHKVSCVLSDAHKLALPDNVFDLVTCQTVLMHCRAPEIALSEMIRIAKPGGRVLLAEPVNLLARIQVYDAIRWLNAGAFSDLVRLWSLYHAGQCQHIGSDHDIAIRLPALMQQAGLEEITAYQNDKVDLAVTDFEAVREEYAKPDIEKYVLAAGGSKGDLAKGLAAFKTLMQRAQESKGLCLSPMGNFLFCGKKRES